MTLNTALAAVVVLLALSGVGCGAEPGTASAASAETMRFVATSPPTTTTPARGPVNLAFTTPRRGFVATTGGRRFVPRDGWAYPMAPGEIERTRDGGATWRTLWRGSLSFDGLAVRGRLVVASGLRLAQTGKITHDRGELTAGPHVLMVSHDGGRTWRRRPALPLPGTVSLQLLTPRLWLAFRAGEETEQRPALLRSTDAGRHWTRAPLPRGTQAIRFVSPLAGVANAHAASCRGPERDRDGLRMQLWRTSDGGRTWRPAAGTCATSYSHADFDVVSPGLVFAVQSGEEGEEGPSVLRRSGDGGATWTTVARDRRHSWIQAHFSDRRRGAVVLVRDIPDLKGGALLLASTRDGGRTWTRHPVPTEGPGDTPGASPLTFAGHDAWLGHDLAGVIWHKRDGGRSWRLSTAPRYLDPGSDDGSHVMLAGGGRLIVSSAAGPIQTRDRGRTWTPSRWPSDRDAAVMEGRNAYISWGHDFGNHLRLVTPTGSRKLRRPKGRREISEVVFSSSADGVLVEIDADEIETLHVTHDGGRTWTSLASPQPRRSYDAFALAPGLIVDAVARGVYVSTDYGASWQLLAWPRRPARGARAASPVRISDATCAPSRPTALDIWITCSGDSGTVLFRSGDGGRTWTRHVSTRVLDMDLRGTGGPEAWATSPSDDSHRSTSTLWHTTDGGATWSEAWVSLPPQARARQIDCVGVPSGAFHDPLPICR